MTPELALILLAALAVMSTGAPVRLLKIARATGRARRRTPLGGREGGGNTVDMKR